MDDMDARSLLQLLNKAQSRISETLAYFTIASPGEMVSAQVFRLLIKDAQDNLTKAAKFVD